MERDLEEMLRDALDAEPPMDADARICATIRHMAASRRRAGRWRILAAAAAIAVLLSGGVWLHGRHPAVAEQQVVSQADESELMLEIIDMAEPLDFEPIQVALL